ncbi:MAG: hypothetical protein J2P38_00020 [Candidatus Dormibacteraeota bacterium]|nr:hypothetical protein [Candidatus Dormibacteraeota bacterium]
MTGPDLTPVGKPTSRTGRPVLAVGWPLGFQALVDSGEVTDTPWQVHLGGEFLDLPEDAYRVWSLAVGGASRPELIKAAAAAGIAEADDAEEIVGGLMRADALVELDDDPLANSDIFEHLCICRVGIGLGNSAERPNAFRIGRVGGGVLATVDPRVFGVWSLSNGSVSIAEACRRLAANFSHTEEPDAEDFSWIVRQLAVNLRPLIRGGSAFLDLHGR